MSRISEGRGESGVGIPSLTASYHVIYSVDMTKEDRIIAHLMDALDAIRREADKADASRHYILGCAEGAMKACDAQRERNSDGYLVVRA